MCLRRGVLCLLFLLLMPLALNTRALDNPPTPAQEVASVAGQPSVHQAFDWVQARESELKKLQVEMVKIPAPPFDEGARAAWLKAKFAAAGLAEVAIDKAGNVTGLRRGTDGKAKLIALTAHIDTVFPAGTQINPKTEGSRIYAPGISDNGAGLIGLLATAMALKAANVKHAAGILFVGNVGEEGEGDLRGMRHLFLESKWKDRIGATIVLDGSGTDTVVTQALGSKRFEVTVRGPGGHSWADYGIPNPIVALARAAASFSESQTPADPRTTFNLGVISGGTSVNSIPESASMKVDIRSAAPAEIDRLEKALRDVVAQAVKETTDTRPGISRKAVLGAEVTVIGSRPAADLKADARIGVVMKAVDSHLGLRSQPRRASTDANIPLSLGREALSIGAGGTGGEAHTVHEWFDAAGRDLGLKRVLLLTLTMAGVRE